MNIRHTTAAIAFIMAVLSTEFSGVWARNMMDAQRDSVCTSRKLAIIGQHGEPTASSDSVRHLIDMFYYDQFRHFQDPEAPYFLFMSKDATLAMGMGGAVRMRAYVDWHGSVQSPGFAPYLIPMRPDPAKMRKFGTTPAGSSLFFRVIGRNKTVGSYQIYIEANFNGYQARDFHLKKAYAAINDFTIGYTVSTFSDPMALPPTVDAQGPVNKISGSTVLIRYTKKFGKGWSAAVSAENTPSQADISEGGTKVVDNWIPDGAAFLQYEWGPTTHIRLAGIVRSLSYRDLTDGTNHHKAGWGVMLSGIAHPAPQVTTFASINYGHGYSSLGGDLQIGNYDMVPVPGQKGRLYAPASMGWCAGVQYNFRPNLFASTSVSRTHYLPAHTPDGAEYKYGMVAAINTFWNLTPRIQIGAEIDWGMRRNFDGDHNHAWRAGAMVQFSF